MNLKTCLDPAHPTGGWRGGKGWDETPPRLCQMPPDGGSGQEELDPGRRPRSGSRRAAGASGLRASFAEAVLTPAPKAGVISHGSCRKVDSERLSKRPLVTQLVSGGDGI